MRAGPRSIVAAVAVAVLSLVPAAAGATVGQTVQVEMSDGVKLATHVVLPDDSGGPWPTLFARSPYAMEGLGAELQKGLELVAAMGYASVFQDIRGTGDSGGEPQPFLSDRSDGLESLAWVLSQPWTDGRVLMAGASAVGIPAYLMAPGADPAMHCQFVAIATPDVYAHGAFQGGVLREHDVSSWTSWVGMQELLPQIVAHRDCDAFWQPARVTAMGTDVRAAALHVGGWSDMFLQGTIDGYLMYRQSSDALVATSQYLVIGPWHHGGMGESSVGDFKLPEASKFDLIAAAINWLGWCFNGGGQPVDSWPRVRYWVMGAVGEEGAPGNTWREADDWPPFQTVDTPLYLAPEKGLAPGEPPLPFEVAVPFDPADPSPTRGGRNLAMAAGPKDQAKVESRPDAATFTTEPLVEPLEATGRWKAHLWVATDGADADVAVRVTDVYPDGRSMLVVDGIARLSRRAGCEAAVPVVPGEPVEVEVDLWSMSWVFNTGHRVRVVVSGSNHPRFELNPAVSAPITIRVYGGADRPSALWLPVPAPEPPDPDPVPEAAAEDGPDEATEDELIGPEAGDAPEQPPEPSPEATPEQAFEARPDSAPEALPDPSHEEASEFSPDAVDHGHLPETAGDAGGDELAPEHGPEEVPGDLASTDPGVTAGHGGGCASGRPSSSAASLFILLFVLASVRPRRVHP